VEDLLDVGLDTGYIVSAKSGEKPHWLPCKDEHNATAFIPGAGK
jgi:hypothetical protein